MLIAATPLSFNTKRPSSVASSAPSPSAQSPLTEHGSPRPWSTRSAKHVARRQVIV